MNLLIGNILKFVKMPHFEKNLGFVISFLTAAEIVYGELVILPPGKVQK